MASEVRRNITPLGFPVNFKRSNAIPLDSTSVWDSLRSAVEYAANDPTAYVGQVITVVNRQENNCAVYVIANTVGDLTAIMTDVSLEALSEADLANIISNS